MVWDTKFLNLGMCCFFWDDKGGAKFLKVSF